MSEHISEVPSRASRHTHQQLSLELVMKMILRDRDFKTYTALRQPELAQLTTFAWKIAPGVHFACYVVHLTISNKEEPMLTIVPKTCMSASFVVPWSDAVQHLSLQQPKKTLSEEETRAYIEQKAG